MSIKTLIILVLPVFILIPIFGAIELIFGFGTAGQGDSPLAVIVAVGGYTLCVNLLAKIEWLNRWDEDDIELTEETILDAQDFSNDEKTGTKTESVDRAIHLGYHRIFKSIKVLSLVIMFIGGFIIVPKLNNTMISIPWDDSKYITLGFFIYLVISLFIYYMLSKLPSYVNWILDGFKDAKKNPD